MELSRTYPESDHRDAPLTHTRGCKECAIVIDWQIGGSGDNVSQPLWQRLEAGRSGNPHNALIELRFRLSEDRLHAKLAFHLHHSETHVIVDIQRIRIIVELAVVERCEIFQLR
jgi:hypothetical protein